MATCTVTVVIQDQGTAPYAPAEAVKRALDAYRQNGLAISATNLARLGVGGSIAPRVVHTLKVLDLLDKDGNPTQALNDFKVAPSDRYREVLAETLRAAYAPIFAVTGPDPSTASSVQMDDAFRTHTPDSLRPRMIRLFLGLCEYAGIIAEAPKTKPGPRTGSTSTTTAAPSRPKPTPRPPKPEAEPPATPAAPIPGRDPLVTAYFDKLPPTGAAWGSAERDKWLAALKAIFEIVYVEPDPL
jgi:hypothetical protein